MVCVDLMFSVTRQRQQHLVGRPTSAQLAKEEFENIAGTLAEIRCGQRLGRRAGHLGHITG